MRQVLIALDQLANTLVGGYADETISARAYRKRWKRREAFINWLFRDPDHCRSSFESETARAQLPSDYREK
jgi:hypothetical protein